MAPSPATGNRSRSGPKLSACSAGAVESEMEAKSSVVPSARALSAT
jgi:hypothetical protein